MQSKLPVSSVHIEVKAPVAHFQCHALRLSMSGHWWLNQSDSLFRMTCKTLTHQYRPGGTSSRSTQGISLLDFIRSTTNSQLSTRIHLHWTPASFHPSAGGLGTFLSTGPPHQLTNIHHLPSRSPVASPAVSHTKHLYQNIILCQIQYIPSKLLSCVNKYQYETRCFIPSALTW